MKRPRTRHTRVLEECARAGLYCLAALTITSCIVDDDNKCGANQVPSDVPHVSGCECAAGSVLNADGIGCTACGANASVQNGACACDTGYAQVTAGGPCIASQLAAPCSATAPCAGEYPYCTPSGYCSKSGCASSTDCPGGYTCDTGASPAYCRKPATGIGATCTMPGLSPECASNDAKYCAIGPMGGGCVVSGCKTVKGRCDVGFSCCDLTSLGVTDMCISNTQLQGGKCPGIPGMLMDPVVVP